METKRIMGVGLNIWGCREQFNGLRSTGRHLNLFWKNVTTKSRWPSWSKAPVSWHGFESWWLPFFHLFCFQNCSFIFQKCVTSPSFNSPSTSFCSVFFVSTSLIAPKI